MRIGKYESSSKSNVGTAVTFLMIGVGAGALIALMLAPKTGKQMRKDLRKRYDDARDTLQDWSEEAIDRRSKQRLGRRVAGFGPGEGRAHR